MFVLICNRVDDIQQPRNIVKRKDSTHASDSAELEEECTWGNYARGALYALQRKGNYLAQVKLSLLSFSMNVTHSSIECH